MAMSKRERAISAVLLAACAALALDRLALRPYLERRDELVRQRQAATAALVEARQVLRDERRLRARLGRMDASLGSDPSAAEGQLLRLLQESEQQAGVSGASFQRTNTIDEHGFTRLAFQLSATGRMPAVALLMYRIESAPIPLRVDDAQFHSKQEGGEELQVHLTVSTLCRVARPARPAPELPSLALSGDAGGRQ